jgi:hypothetical protein
LNNNDRTAVSLTINTGATLDDDGQNLTITGNLVNNGTFGTNGGALIMNGANTTISGTGVFNNTDVQTDASGISLPLGSTMSFNNGAQLRVGRDNPGTFTLNGAINGTGLASGDRILRVHQNSSATVSSTGVINAPNAYIRVEQDATLTNNGSVTVQYLDSDGNNPTSVWTQGTNSSLTLSQTPNNTWRGTLNASASNNTVTYTANVTPLTPSSNTYYNISHPSCAAVSGFTILGSSPCGPTVTSANRASTNPTAPATAVTWTVIFGASVTGVNAADFALVQAGGVSGATLTSVSGSGTTYTVTANTGSGSGTLGLNVLNDGTIMAGAVPLSGGTFTGQVYTVTGPAVCTTVLTGVVNTYYPASGTVAAGASSITLGTSAGNATTLAANDLVLIVQMQDATINAADTNAYGANNATGSGATSLGNSGLYEYKVVQSFSAGVATFTSPLVNSYTSAAATSTAGQKTFQVIRVPTLATYTLSTAPTALAWNGGVGGVLAFDVTGALTFSGNPTISVDGVGFRGGAGRTSGSGSGNNTAYRTNAGSNGANGAKGEGIAGTSSTSDGAGAYGYPNGSNARGAPANAGGGGTDGNPAANDQNSGGGGGGGYGSGGMGGIPWCGSFNAGTLPAYNCPDGSHPNNNFNNGGVGGTGVAQSASRLTSGGGGGAATSNNGFNVSGAAGGGLVFVRAGSLSGNATFTAKGATAASTACNDGTGGGGGGGAVLIQVGSGNGLSNISINVGGGTGGSNLIPPCNSGPHGPGGGGGGGYAVTSVVGSGSSTTASCTAAGGANGITYRNGTLFGAYGAVGGSAGACVATTGTTSVGATLGSGPCAASGPHHLEIQHGSGAGVTCTPSTLTIKACADTLNPCTAYTGGVTGTLSATGAGTPTVNWVGGTSFTIGASGSVTKDVQVTTVGSTVFSTPSATCNFGSPSCTFTSTLAGFIFDVPNHVSDTLQTVNVSAVKQSDSSLACTPAFATSKNVSFACIYSNPASGTLPVAVNGTNIACGTAGGVSLAFNASGVASTTFRYADVGSVGLTATYTGSGGTETGLTMTGSDSFIAAPASFTVVPAGPYIAGSAFSATVTAKNASGNTTPNFGKETTAATVTLTHTVTGGTAGTAPADFVGTLGAFGATTAGVASGNNLAWKEVGDISVTGTLTGGSYLGSGLTATGSGPAGPFKPGYFETVVAPAAGTFTYSGQPFSVQIIAKSNWAGNPTTTNYDNTLGYSKAITLTDANSGANNSSTLGALTNASVPAASFSGGEATVGTITYTFTNKLTAPLESPGSSPLQIRATETADATVSSSGHESLTTSVTSIRSGRVRMANAYGSERLVLPVMAQAEYYTAAGWILNTADTGGSATPLAAPPTVTVTGGITTDPNCPPPTACTTSSRFSGGLLDLRMTAPNAAGYADVTLDVPAWLEYPWRSAVAEDPTSRVTFGIYKGNNKIIYRRERY